ncbi:hypothetical protein [Candidatus Nitrospira nitrificans]|uniref:hypothetical protein n=1 Tax=Candidatus Nitrospira nitrificans TaxID=1742973 RepID=UPI000AD1CD31|nr:hypothetical protein [Candidatus Nitrospira nitrificans]
MLTRDRCRPARQQDPAAIRYHLHVQVESQVREQEASDVKRLKEVENENGV